MNEKDIILAMQLTAQTRTVHGIFVSYDERYQILTIEQYENDITKTHTEKYFVKNIFWNGVKGLKESEPGKTVIEISCPLVMCIPSVDQPSTYTLAALKGGDA